jgi:hypothetical protein
MITRRKLLTLSAAAAVTAALPAGAWGAGQPTGSKKKGLGLGARNPLWPGILATLRCKWVYTWTGNVPTDLPEGTGFIPMIRSGGITNTDAIAKVADQAKANNITELLGLNEPDAAKQDDMTVEAALDAWPLLMETGLRLGSPGCIHPDKDWMAEFMAGVEERKLRVDFVCVHSYGGPNPKAFLRRLENVSKLYNRPLWITEFGIGDWAAKSVEENQYPPEIVLRFMEEVLPMLDNLDCLERYAWFPAKPDSIPLGSSALFDEQGVLTPLGEFYRDA